MKELSKSIHRRMMNPAFIRNYFYGNGIDIGGKSDPLNLYQEIFPFMDAVKIWDIEEGDAQYMKDVKDDSYDFVHSSHCLEHLHDPYIGIKNWFRILKPSSYMVFTVPDEDLYEQGVFPSTFNADHKWTFTINKSTSWSNKSINLFHLLSSLGRYAQVEKIELLSTSYRYKLPRFDQTLTPISECGIECVIRKLTQEEADYGGIIRKNLQSNKDIRTHVNQYIDDHKMMKECNKKLAPFKNTKDI